MPKIDLNSKEALKLEYDTLKEELDEQGKRKWAGMKAKSLGHGGKKLIKHITGLSYPTILKGIKDIESGNLKGRIRKVGGGRKLLSVSHPEIIERIEDIVDNSTIGNPENPLKYTSKSTRNIQNALKDEGHKVSQRSVCNILRTQGYSLQSNRKSLSGSNVEGRDEQFQFINNKVKEFQSRGCPVISVDSKKKELVGNYNNTGQEYHKKGNAPKVNIYDFVKKTESGQYNKATPYGVYDITLNSGWVNVGISSDTAEFAVNTIRTWWNEVGKQEYSESKELYINADGGGSNGSRVRLWKLALQRLANETGLTIHVSHFPPGTSKWNKIEHKMFSFISKNWRGKPLIDYATIVNLIGNTKTQKGLKVKAVLDKNEYEKGTKVSDEEMEEINISAEDIHGKWNYIIAPN